MSSAQAWQCDGHSDDKSTAYSEQSETAYSEQSEADFGFMYVATGDNYRAECKRSAASVKAAMPDIPITVFSDTEFDSPQVDTIVRLDEPKYGSSDVIASMASTPYERTIYLDTDTYVETAIDEVFRMLERFDLAVVIDPIRAQHRPSPDPGVPDNFPEYNSGVVGFRRSDPVDEFFETWKRLYQAEPDRTADQPAFRDAIYRTPVNVVTLPFEYNCLYDVFPGYLYGDVKVFHGRLLDEDGFEGLRYSYDPAEVRATLNASDRARVYTHSTGLSVFVDDEREFSLPQKILYAIRREGMLETLREAKNWLAAGAVKRARRFDVP